MDSQAQVLGEYLEKCSRAVAITGAGISFSSGGLSFDDSSPQAMQDMMILGSGDELKDDPDRYYRMLDQAFLHSMLVCGPSSAHKALARLEDEGKLAGIITTNIDCLHTIAGSKNVAEIQGSLQVNRCIDCGCHYDDYRIWSHGKVPECEKCGGKIWAFPFYSNIGLNQDEVKHARKLIGKADLILIIGANGAYSGSYWPFRNRRAKIVQINPGNTYFDRAADLNIRQSADSVFSDLFGEDSEI